MKKEEKHKSNRDLVLKEYEKGNIVVIGIDGIKTIPLKDFVKEPLESMLYELNRDESVILTFIDDPKWINDYACCKVISELKKHQKKRASIHTKNTNKSENLLPKTCFNCIYEKLEDNDLPCEICDEDYSEFVSIEDRFKQEIIESSEAGIYWIKNLMNDAELKFKCGDVLNELLEHLENESNENG